MVQNVIRHAFMATEAVGVLKMKAMIVGSDLLIEIVDDAPPSDPALWSSATSAAQHGGHELQMIG